MVSTCWFPRNLFWDFVMYDIIPPVGTNPSSIRDLTFFTNPSGELLYTILYSIINKIYPIEH